jgi:WD40 repeat protein
MRSSRLLCQVPLITCLLLLGTAAAKVSAQGVIVAIETDQMLHVVYSPGGKLIAGGGMGKKVRVWDAKTGTVVRTIDGLAPITRAVAISSDDKLLATGGDDGFARVWDLATGKLVIAWVGHAGMISSLAFSPDGKHLAAASGASDINATRGEVKLWDFAANRPSRSFQTAEGFHPKLAFSPDSKTLATAAGSLQLWDVVTGRLTKTIKPEGREVLCVAYSADGKTLAGGGGHWIKKGGGTIQISEAWLWDAESGKLRRSFTDLNTWLRSIALSADGTRLATGCTGPIQTKGALSWVPAELKLWDAATGKELWYLHGAPGDLWSIAFAPDGKSLVSTDPDSVRLTDAESGKITKVLAKTVTGNPGN